MRISIFALTVILVSCAGAPSGSLSVKEVRAVRSAEAFILRNGYTVAGHPKDLPVQEAEILDAYSTPDELITSRQNTLETSAFGVTPCMCDRDAFYVFFHSVNHADGFRGVLVQNDEAVQVVHSVLILEDWPWKHVPPNESLERTRER